MSHDCRLKGKWIHEFEGQSFIPSPAATTMPSLLTLSVSPVVPPVPAARVPFGPAAFCLLRRILRLWKKEKSIKGGARILGNVDTPINHPHDLFNRFNQNFLKINPT